MEKDSLHNLFSNKFKEPTKGDMNWVNPDDSIFENVLTELNQKDRKKWFYWRNRYGFLLLLLISVAGSLAIYSTGMDSKQHSNNTTGIVESQLLNMPHEEASLQDEQKLAPGNLTAKNKESTTTSKKAISVNQKSTFQNQIYTNVNNSSSVAKNNTHVEPTNSLFDGNQELIINPNNHLELTESLDIGLARLSSLSPLSKLEPSRLPDNLEFLQNSLNTRRFPTRLGDIKIPESAELKEVKSPVSANRSMSLSAGVLYSSVRHPKGQLSNHMLMEGHDHFQGGWHLEASYNRQLGDDWTIHGSLGFNRIQMESMTTYSLYYDAANELMSQGELIYHTPLKLITPTTGFVDNVQFIIQEGTMSGDDMLTNTLNISQGISTLSLGIGLSNRLFTRNAFSLGAGIDVGINYIVKIQERMQLELMAEDYMLFQKDKEWVNHRGLNRFGTFAGIHVFAQWSLTDKHSLFVNPSYRRSLTSIRARDVMSERSYFTIYNVSIGMNINF